MTPETARLLKHWRHHALRSVRPFFCQIEAVETAIWLTEVAPKLGPRSRQVLGALQGGQRAGEPGALAPCAEAGDRRRQDDRHGDADRLADGQRRSPSEQRSSSRRGFLIVAPGITIKDRLRVLLPNDPDSYYRSRELVPADMLADIDQAKIVITNYHAFKLRETHGALEGRTRAAAGRAASRSETLETEGQMLQRVCRELMGLKNIVVINDEAHHCYREKPGDATRRTSRATRRKRPRRTTRPPGCGSPGSRR